MCWWFLSPQPFPGLYCEFEALPLPPPPPPPAMTVPVPAAIRDKVSTVARTRDLIGAPFRSDCPLPVQAPPSVPEPGVLTRAPARQGCAAADCGHHGKA